MQDLPSREGLLDHLPLSGVKVVDLSRIMAGPLCAMALADMGAEVVKIESPSGDETRGWGPPFTGGESAYFLALNRNKRSMVLDLTDDDGRAPLVELIAGADVLIENFRPGKMEKWGIGADALSGRNPGLVHCSITGFGESGPYREYPGFDPVIEAMTGFMSLNGPPDRFEPYKAGVAVVDVLAAHQAAFSIVALLMRRNVTGTGGRTSLSLMDVALASLVNVASSYLISGEPPQRLGNDHPHISPFGVFPTARGFIMICVGNNKQWQALCRELGLVPDDPPLIADNRGRVTNRDLIRRRLEERLQAGSAEEWAARLMTAGVPAGQINTVDAALQDPHVEASGILQTVEHPKAGAIRLVASPVILDGHRLPVRLPPPTLGDAADFTWEVRG